MPTGRSKRRAQAERISLPEEPAGAAIRAPSALDVPADWLLEAFLEAFQFLVNSAYHSVFTFLVRVERIYSDSWLSSSLAARSSGRARGCRRARVTSTGTCTCNGTGTRYRYACTCRSIATKIIQLHSTYVYVHAVHVPAVQRPSPADVGVDQIRNKKLQIHACAHKRVYVFTMTDHQRRKGPFSPLVSVRLSID